MLRAPGCDITHLCVVFAGLVPGRQSSLSVIARVFDTLNAVYKEHLKAATARSSVSHVLNVLVCASDKLLCVIIVLYINTHLAHSSSCMLVYYIVPCSL